MEKPPSLDRYRLDDYVIKQVSSTNEMRETMIAFEELEGCLPAFDDHMLFYNTDPQGFFIGQLNGKTISCVNIVKYSDSYAFLGTFIVLKEHRGNGYGLALFKHAMESVPATCNVALDAAPDTAPLYCKWGFMDSFMNYIIQVDLMTAAAKLESFNPPSDVLVQPAKMIDFHRLSVYDTTVFGAPHHLFLRGLLDGPNTITLAATNQNGNIVGLVAACKTIVEKDGWKLAPLFADNGQVARALLKLVLKEMIQDAPERKVAELEVALEENHDARTLSEELNATTLIGLSRMFTNEELEFPKEKYRACSLVRNTCSLHYYTPAK